jgi:polyisoprenoid-binding protein YceI
MDSFVASLTSFDATVSADPAEKHVSAAQIKFRFSDVKTANDKRDAEMNHWEQTEQFPDCIYVLDTLQPATGGTFTAHGKFTLHGVTKEITFPVTVSFQDANLCKIDGDVPLDTRDYGLSVIRKFAMLKVNPVLQVKFHLEGHI